MRPVSDEARRQVMSRSNSSGKHRMTPDSLTEANSNASSSGAWTIRQATACSGSYAGFRGDKVRGALPTLRVHSNKLADADLMRLSIPLNLIAPKCNTNFSIEPQARESHRSGSDSGVA